jgi:hypothetical protein
LNGSDVAADHASGAAKLTWQNYTLRGNLGLININVDDPGKDDIASRYLPMQWAIDSVSAFASGHPCVTANVAAS